MWIKPNEKLHPPNETKQKYQSRNYPSKVLSQLMNSDSEDDYLEQINQIKQIQKNKTYKKQHPPLLINSKQCIKQNLSDHANKISKQIKYQCYKLCANKLLEVPSSGQFNSLNLQQTSMIPQNIESQQFQKQSQQPFQNQKHLLNRITELQQRNKALQNELNIVNEKLLIKQINTSNEIQSYKKKLKQYEQKQKINKKQQPIKKQNQFYKYLQKKNKQNYPLFNQNNNNQQIIQNTYKSIKIYLIKIIQQFKNKISLQKMNQFVQDIIQQFMTQLININSITVARVASKNNRNCSPTLIRQTKKILPQDDISLLSKSCLFKQNTNTQSSQNNPTKTPPKPAKKANEQKQKPQQLKQLQKSLTKLRQMQKQYANKKHSNINKDTIEQLDRSSFLGFDLSRSKSRRKKIFQ